MMMKFRAVLVAIAAAAALLAPVAPAAQAESTIPSQFKVSGWWNDTNTGSLNPGNLPEGRFLWPNFPVACNNDNTKSMFRAYYVYPSDEADQKNAGAIRDALAAVTGAVAASAREVVGGTSGLPLKSVHAPKWDTYQNAAGDCFPTAQSIAVPRSVMNVDVFSTSGLDSWLRSHGYLPDNVKGVVYTQSLWSSCSGGLGTNNCWGGVWSESMSANPDPAVNPNNTGGSALYVKLTASMRDDWRTFADLTLHELTHALGAVVTGSPHKNPLNNAHPTDCYDVLCYNSASLGETVACPWNGLTSLTDYQRAQPNYRLDCNKDDYFNVDHPTWETARWNTALSSFLWANSAAPYSEGPPRRGPGPGEPDWTIIPDP